MGYRITYEHSGAVKRKKWNMHRLKINKTHFLTACCGLLFLLLICSVAVPQFRMGLCRLILPGDPDVTALALEQMADRIGTGASLPAALTEFCRTVLEGA